MDSYKETFETWNKVARLYEDRFMDYDLYNDSYDIFCKLIEKINPRILEIGCGPGNITRYMLSKRPDFNIEGIDIAPNMIELARKNNPAAKFETMDARDIDRLKPTFDAIICGFCLPYLSNSSCFKLIKDCSNLLSNAGILYISFEEGDYGSSGYQTASSGDKIYFYYYSVNNIEKVLRENNFEIVTTINKDYHRNETNAVHSILIATKMNV